MQQVSIHAARTNLAKLIDAALSGEDVFIAKDNTPVVRLVPVAQGSFRIGVLKGKLGTLPDFHEPMAPGDLHLWEGGR